MSHMICHFTFTMTLFVPLIAMAEFGEPIPVKGSELWCAALSPDGCFAVGCYAKGKDIRLWNLKTGKLVRRFRELVQRGERH